MGDVDGLAHDVDLAGVGAAVVRAQVRDLQAVVVADADPSKVIFRFDLILTRIHIWSNLSVTQLNDLGTFDLKF